MADRLLFPASDFAAGGSPQYAVIFDGSATEIACGSDASLDDLGSGAEFTIDALVKRTGDSADDAYGVIAAKGFWGTGWGMAAYDTNSNLYNTVFDATIPRGVGVGGALSLDTWVHVALYYNAASRKVKAGAAGAWSAYSAALPGPMAADAAYNFIMGRRSSSGGSHLHAQIAWLRVSDNDRLGGAGGIPFTPLAKDAPPAVDANTVEQWNFNEGSGSTAAAEVDSPTNDGTITNGTWSSL